MMKKSKFSESEILSLLAAQGKEKSVEELCREEDNYLRRNYIFWIDSRHIYLDRC